MVNVSKIMEFEDGQLDEEQTIELFADLVKDGSAWTLQGSYGRMAQSLIEQEYITAEGEIL